MLLIDVRSRDMTVFDVWCNVCETVVDTLLRQEDTEQVGQDHAELHCAECLALDGHRPTCSEATRPVCNERWRDRQCEVTGPHSTHGFDLGKIGQTLWRAK